MSILRPTFCFLLIAALLLVTAHRLPAPIQEIPESPTPAPEQSAKPKSKPSKSKSRNTESEGPAKRQPKPSHERFGGTWVGTIKVGLMGTVQITWVVNPGGTELKSTSSLGTSTQHPTNDGKTATWRGGAGIIWTFTPSDDGRTALVTSKSVLGVNTATFQRTQSSQAAQSNPTTKTPQPSVQQTTTATATAKETEVPVARPVPDKPGFVYNPFDSNTKVLLDVRGKASGTKVKDPSGRLFIIP